MTEYEVRKCILKSIKPNLSLLAGVEVPVDLSHFGYGYFTRPQSVHGDYKDMTPTQDQYKTILCFARQFEEAVTPLNHSLYGPYLENNEFPHGFGLAYEVLTKPSNGYFDYNRGHWYLSTKSWRLFGIDRIGRLEHLRATHQLKMIVTGFLCLNLNLGVKLMSHGWIEYGHAEFKRRTEEIKAVGKTVHGSIVFDFATFLINSGKVKVDGIVVTNFTTRVNPGSKLTIEINGEVAIPSLGSPYIIGVQPAEKYHVERTVNVGAINVVVPPTDEDNHIYMS